MNRTGLIIALAVAAAVGIVFGFYPDLDLRLSQPFYEIVSGGANHFGLRLERPLMILRDTMLWLVALVLIAVGCALVLKLIAPPRRLLVPARAIVFLASTMALGPGLVTNVILKDNWSRSRPIDVRQFGGQETFVPWWDPRGDCRSNCSFVSGDASGAYWLLAPAALTPPTWRPLAYAGAVAFGAGMSVLRMAFGGHFFTDTIFAGVFTFLVIWLMHGLIYRWPRTRLSDSVLEQAIERAAMPAYRLVCGLLGGKQKPSR